MKRKYIERTRTQKELYGDNIYKIWGSLGGGRVLHHLKKTGEIDRIKRSIKKDNR